MKQRSSEIGTPAAAAGRVVLIYAAFATLWILASDAALEALLRDFAQWARAEMFKGLLFVAVSAALLYVLVSRLLRTMRDALSVELGHAPLFDQSAVNAAEAEFNR